jgi:hypothetical protein
MPIQKCTHLKLKHTQNCLNVLILCTPLTHSKLLIYVMVYSLHTELNYNKCMHNDQEEGKTGTER